MKLATFQKFAQEETHLSWLIKDLLIDHGWTYLVGAPGSGKSFLCLQICNALQDGLPFLGMETSQRNCLYIQADETQGEWQAQIRKVAENSSAWTMYNVPGGILDSKTEVKEIHELVWGKHPKTKHLDLKFGFIVFDSLTALSNWDANTNQIMKAHEAMQFICTDGEEKIPYLLIHHPSKTLSRGTNAGAGYGGLARVCSVMLTLSHNVLRLEKGRTVPGRDIAMNRLENGLWDLGNENPFESDFRPTKSAYPELAKIKIQRGE